MKTEHYTVEQVAEALRKSRGKVYLAAQRLGCHVNTLRGYLKRHEELAEVLEDARGLRVDIAEVQLEDATQKGEPWAVLYTLSTLGKDRGYTKKEERSHDHTLKILRLPAKATDPQHWLAEYGEGDGGG
jgi:hypothetical protein